MTATSREVVEMLRRHYLPEGRPAGGILASEIEAPTSQRRADALWAPLTLSGGPGLVGHEIKVTRADVVVELNDPTKADAWGRYCRQWWLTVSDPSLILGLTVPDAWGIMAPPSGRRTRSMTILRPAPVHKVGDDGPAWRRVMAWHAHRIEQEVNQLASDKHYRDAEIARLRQRLADGDDAALRSEDRRGPRVRAILALLDQKMSSDRIPDLPWANASDITDDDVASALADLAWTRRVSADSRRDLTRLIETVRKASEPLKTVANSLAAIEGISHD